MFGSRTDCAFHRKCTVFDCFVSEYSTYLTLAAGYYEVCWLDVNLYSEVVFHENVSQHQVENPYRPAKISLKYISTFNRKFNLLICTSTSTQEYIYKMTSNLWMSNIAVACPMLLNSRQITMMLRRTYLKNKSDGPVLI